MSYDPVLPFPVHNRPISAYLRDKYAAILPFMLFYQGISYLYETVSQEKKKDQAI